MTCISLFQNSLSPRFDKKYFVTPCLNSLATTALKLYALPWAQDRHGYTEHNRRSQRGPSTPHIFGISSHFVLWEAAPQTKILLLTWSHTFFPPKKFRAGCATAQHVGNGWQQSLFPLKKRKSNCYLHLRVLIACKFFLDWFAFFPLQAINNMDVDTR